MDKQRRKKTVEDTVCRVHKSGGYAVLNNCYVRSTNIGCDSIALLSKVIDLPPTWNFTIAGLTAICKDGETAIRSQLAELGKWGYVKKKKQMPNESSTGRIHYVYDLYEYSELDDSIPKYDIKMETFTINNATLNRVEKESNFTMISANLLRSREIRNKYIGFMLKVSSLPNCWNYTMSGLVSICKEGRTAVHNAVNKLIGLRYLVRTKLLSNESVHNCFEYVYSFFDDPISKEKAKKVEAETRRKAITVREGGRARSAVSSTAEKQEVENPYLDNPSAESPLSENQGQYNTYNTIQKNQLLSDKSSIILPAPQAKIFGRQAVERKTERAKQEEMKTYTEIVKENICYDELGEWLTVDGRDGYAEADSIVGFIVDEICSPLPYATLRGTSLSRAVIQSKMLQADINMVQSVLQKMVQVDNIKDFRRYFISSLYNEVLTYHFNEGCESRWADYAVKRDFGYPA